MAAIDVFDKLRNGMKLWPKFVADFGIHVNYENTMKKAAFKKYHRCFGYRWLSRIEKQQALLNAIIDKGSGLENCK